MKTLKRIISRTIWLLLSFMIMPGAVTTAQVKEMSAKELTNESTAVFYGKCSKIEAKWNDKKSIIFTYVTVVPEAYIKGNLGSEAVITIPGGQVGDILYEVSEMPLFIEGEDVMAFTWKDPAGKNLVTGGYQGKMKIEKDDKTGKRMVNTAGIAVEPDAQIQPNGKTTKPEKVLLEDFVTKLKSYQKN